MDSKYTDNLRNITPWRFGRISCAQAAMVSLIAALSGVGLLSGSCQRDTATDQPAPSVAPETTPQAGTDSQDTETASEPNTTPQQVAPNTTSGTATDAPKNTSTAQPGASLPDTLTRQWEPASNVLFTFGAMTITPDQVQWSSGQSSPYTVVSTGDGYLLQLESSPMFYETQNPYIKLIPKTDEAGGTTSVDVAFYESSAKAESDDYIMYGSYFVE